jgi:hypothetical protein
VPLLVEFPDVVIIEHHAKILPQDRSASGTKPPRRTWWEPPPIGRLERYDGKLILVTT